MRLGLPRVDLDGAPVELLGARLVAAAEADVAEVRVGDGERRIEADGAPVELLGLVVGRRVLVERARLRRRGRTPCARARRSSPGGARARRRRAAPAPGSRAPSARSAARSCPPSARTTTRRPSPTMRSSCSGRVTRGSACAQRADGAGHVAQPHLLLEELARGAQRDEVLERVGALLAALARGRDDLGAVERAQARLGDAEQLGDLAPR